MVQIILIRPATTEFDEQRRILGNLNVPLSPQGSEDVRDLAAELGNMSLRKIYHGPGQSSRETAEGIAELLAVKRKQLDGLHNLDQGLWQGKCIDEVKTNQPKVYRRWQDFPDSICPPEGETLAAARARMQAAVAKIIKKSKGDVCALVVPEPLASLVHCHLTGGQLCDSWQPVAQPATWEVIDVETQNLVQSV